MTQLTFLEEGPVDLRGCRVAITGELPIPRNEVIMLLERAGAIYASEVSRTTDYLIVGTIKPNTRVSPAGSRKLRRAQELMESGGKVKILDSVAFFKSC